MSRIPPPSSAPKRVTDGAWENAPNFVERLDSDPEFAMAEGDAYFQGQGAVHDTLRRIAKRLDELQIKYAVAGGLALFGHGFRRFTQDVDLLVTPEGLKEIHKQLEGLGYIPPFGGSKNLRDTITGVKIDFLVSGQFPGDGKPKPVAFPAPEQAAVEIRGIRYLDLPKIVELKIASGMTGSERLKDLSDVQELIKLLGLGRDFAVKLDPYVRGKYVELWEAARPGDKRYIKLWRNQPLTSEAQAIFDAMRSDGVFTEPADSTSGEFTRLVTHDPDIAAKYGMHDESEFMEGPDRGQTGESK